MVKPDCYCNCLVIKTFMRYMYAAITKHRSIHNALNIKVKFLCYNVKADESIVTMSKPMSLGLERLI